MEVKFAQRVKGLRTDKKMKQIELARALNVTQRKISYWENGQLEPDLLTLWKISDYFEVSIDFLVGKSDY